MGYNGCVWVNCTDGQDESKSPLGARFALYDWQGQWISTSWCDEKGSAKFSNLQEGQYVIKEVKPPDGYRSCLQEFDVTVAPDMPARVMRIAYEPRIPENISFLPATEHTETVRMLGKSNLLTKRILLSQKGELRISCRIDSAHHKPIAGAFYQLSDLSGNIIAKGSTDDEGVLLLQDIPVGIYSLTQVKVPSLYQRNIAPTRVYIHAGEVSEIVSLNVEKEDISLGSQNLMEKTVVNDGGRSSEPFEIQEQQAVEKAMDAFPVPRGNIVLCAVHVRYPNWRLQGCEYVLLDSDGNERLHEVTNENGEALFEDITCGNYYFKQKNPARNYAADDFAYPVTALINQLVKETIFCQPQNHGSLCIHAANMKNKENPIALMRYEIINHQGFGIASSVTNENGDVFFEEIPQGKVRYVLTGANESYCMDMTIYEDEIKQGEMTQRAICYDAMVDSALVIAVWSADQKETPVAKVTIALYDSASRQILMGTSQKNGLVTFEGLIPGTYKYKLVSAPKKFDIQKRMKEIELLPQQVLKKNMFLRGQKE